MRSAFVRLFVSMENARSSASLFHSSWNRSSDEDIFCTSSKVSGLTSLPARAAIALSSSFDAVAALAGIFAAPGIPDSLVFFPLFAATGMTNTLRILSCSRLICSLPDDFVENLPLLLLIGGLFGLCHPGTVAFFIVPNVEEPTERVIATWTQPHVAQEILKPIAQRRTNPNAHRAIKTIAAGMRIQEPTQHTSEATIITGQFRS